MVLFHYLFFSIRNFISFYIVIAELVSIQVLFVNNNDIVQRKKLCITFDSYLSYGMCISFQWATNFSTLAMKSFFDLIRKECPKSQPMLSHMLHSFS